MPSPRSTLFIVAVTGLVASQAAATDFKTQVFPILDRKCSECHSEKKKVKGKFDITKEANFAKHLAPGKPDVSAIVLSVTAKDDDDDVMPPKGKNRVTPAELAILKAWIQEGAKFTAGGAGPAPTAAPAAGSAMDWTNTAGKTVKALFDRLEGDAVVIKTADGTYFTVPLANLSPESQAQAKKAAGQ